MTHLPRAAAITTADWPDFRAELDRWDGEGRVAGFWWRDDDAVAATPQLEALLRLAGDVPLALAVIPALAELGLSAALQGSPNVAVLQHGWRHTNHARLGKKSEFPASRAAEDVAAELSAGADRLKALFGSRFVPILAPPWNRFAPEFLPLLAPAGIAALSAIAAVPPDPLAGGVARIDVHLDPIAWRVARGFIGAETALGCLVGRLRAQRLGGEGPAPAIGILTHHLVMDDATAVFLQQLVATLAGHGAARWLAAGELVLRQ